MSKRGRWGGAPGEGGGAMYLRQIKVFCAIVEEGSFRRASDLLGLSQPSVSQHIAALEKRHGVKLFKRSGRGVVPTPEGRALYMLGSELLKLSEAIPGTFRDMQTLRSGSLSIGAGHHFVEGILPAVIDDFRAEFPEITLSVRTGTPDVLMGALKDGDIEFALIGNSLGVSHDPDLTVRPLGLEPLVLVVPRTHPWEDREIGPAELKDGAFVHYTDNHPLALLLEDYFLRHQVGAQFGLKVDSISMALQLVALGEYVTIAGKSSVSHALMREKLGTATLEGLSGIRWEMQLVYRHALGLSFAGWEMERRIERMARRFLREV